MRYLPPIGLAIVLAGLGIAASGSASAQPLAAQQDASPIQAGQPTASTPATTVFKTTVRRVVLDVVVTDSAGKPVPGLTKDDFTVDEDGKAQQVLSFDANGFAPGMDYLPPELPPEPVNTFVNLPKTPEKGPLYVLLYDLVNMDNPDQMATPGDFKDQIFGRQQLVKFIQDKPEGTRFAIFVRSDGLHLVQGFTSDKELLFRAIDPHNPRPHIPKLYLMGRNLGQGDVYSTIGVLNIVARYLDGLPGRKNLIWLSGAFPLSLFPSNDDVPSYAEQVKRTLDLLAQDQISIYPVDVRGVVVENAHAPTGAAGGDGTVSGASGMQAAPGSSSSPASSQATAAGSAGGGGGGVALLASSYAVEEEIARDTGGRAFYNRNDVANALTDATQTGASYYTLTYAPSNQRYDGKLRKISVELGNKADHLAYRRSYYGLDTDAPASVEDARASAPAKKPSAPPAPRKVGDTLYANMEHGAPIAYQLIFGAHIHAVGSPAKGTPEQMAELATQPAYFKSRRRNAPAKPLPPIELQRYAIDYTVMAHQLQTEGAPPPQLEIAAAAYDADGAMLNATVNNATAENATRDGDQGAPGPKPRHAYRIEQEIEVPLVARSIRVAVRDANTDRIGVMEVELPLQAETQASSAEPPGPARP